MEKFYLVVLILVVIANISINLRKRFLENERRMLEARVKESEIQYQRVVSENKELKAIRHDLYKHMNLVQEYISKEDTEYTSGNKILDVILSSAEEKAVKYEIEFIANINPLVDWRIGVKDTISLFSNILDNAIESAMKVQDKPRIEIEINTARGNYIRIGNSKLQTDMPIDNNFRTTKEDSANHGIGTGIIGKILEENHGTINMSDHGDWFVVEINI